MTLICAAVERGPVGRNADGFTAMDGVLRTVLLGDSFTGHVWDSDSFLEPKVLIHKAGFAFGNSGSWRHGQLLETAKVDPPGGWPGHPTTTVQDTDVGLRAPWNREWALQAVEAFRRSLKDGGGAEVKDVRESGTSAVFATPDGHVYEMHGDYGLGEPRSGVAAVGCGAVAFKAAYFALCRHGPWSLVDLMVEAAKAVAAVMGGVRGPWTIVTLTPDGRACTEERT